MKKDKAIRRLLDLYKEKQNLVILNADDGFFVLDDFYLFDKSRIFNVGIAEQATVGMAAGMAMNGIIPVIYGKIPFILMRAFEQLRYDVNEHNLPVKIFGVGKNNRYLPLGRSHCIDDDDLPLMRILSNFEVHTPNEDDYEHIIQRFINSKGPSLVRLE
jgi:transketolase